MELRCSACGRELPPESRFCLLCGNPVDAATSKTQPLHRFLGYRWLPAAFGVVCVLAAIMVVLVGGRQQAAHMPAGPSPVGMPQVEPPVMPEGDDASSSQTSSGTPPIHTPSTQSTPAPLPAATDYIAKVQKIEEYRRTLYAELLQVEDRVRAAQSSSGGIMPDAFKKQLSAAYNSFTRRSRQLGDYYKTVKPPIGYEEFSAAYDKALARSLWSLQRAYQELDRGNVAAAGAVRSAYQPEVDDELKASDKALDGACRAAGVQKSINMLPDAAADANPGRE
jgi:hypothetical protein